MLIPYHQYHQWQDLAQCEPRQAQIKRETALLSPDHINCSHRTLPPSLPPSYLLSFISCCLWWIFWSPRLCVQQVLMMVIKIWLRITIKTTSCFSSFYDLPPKIQSFSRIVEGNVWYQNGILPNMFYTDLWTESRCPEDVVQDGTDHRVVEDVPTQDYIPHMLRRGNGWYHDSHDICSVSSSSSSLSWLMLWRQ